MTLGGPRNLRAHSIAEADYDAAVMSYKSAVANVAVAKATIKANQAALNVAKTNLGYTTIRSPVRGTIIDRRVNIGQTVVAALNAPSICLIAKDLRRMQVWRWSMRPTSDESARTCPSVSPSMPIRKTPFAAKSFRFA